jgi:hypothetical protein
MATGIAGLTAYAAVAVLLYRGNRSNIASPSAP